MRTYYLKTSSDLVGPFTVDELKMKTVSVRTEIWEKETGKYMLAGDVEELHYLFLSSNMALATAILPASMNSAYTHKARPNSLNRNKNIIFKTLSLFLTILAFAIGSVFAFSHIQRFNESKIVKQHPSGTIMNSPLVSSSDSVTVVGTAGHDSIQYEKKIMYVRSNINSYVTTEKTDYTYNIIGGINNLKISVINASDYVLESVRVKVSYMKANGQTFKVEFIDFKNVKPQSKMVLKAPNSTRGTKVKHEITGVLSAELGLY